MAAATDYVYRRDPAELTLLRFYEGDFKISGVYSFESGRDTFAAIKSEIPREIDSRSTLKYGNLGHVVQIVRIDVIWIGTRKPRR